MAKFTDPLIVEHLDGRNWMVVEDFEYHVGSKDSKEVIEVEDGFITDFASIPRVFWIFLGSPAGGQYGKSAVIHDWLYRKGIGTRKRADEIFLEGMEVLNVNKVRRTLMFWGVRLFGWSSWQGK